MSEGVVVQVSVSDGGVPKLAVEEARVGTLGLEGDHQRNLRVHGGPERAVCLFSFEVIEALQAEGHPIVPGSAGENVTVAGLDWTTIVPGVRMCLGDAVELEVTSYTLPCANNARWFADRNFDRIHPELHPGWSRVYARVTAEGSIRPGDPVTVMRD